MMHPRPTPRTQYKKPGGFNVVSFMLLVIVAGLGYAGYCLWPVASAWANTKDELNGALPQIYRANLRPTEQVNPEVVRIRKMLTENLHKGGIKDKELVVKIILGKKVVAAEAHFNVNVFFPGLNKNRDIPVNVHVETDAERVEW